MALRTMTGKVSRPDGVTPASVSVEVVLSQAAVIAGTGELVPASIPVVVNPDGSYSFNAQDNASLSPGGTYYTVTETVNGVKANFQIVVPTSGPWTVSQNLSGTPTAVPSAGRFAQLTVDGQATFTAGPVSIGAALPAQAQAVSANNGLVSIGSGVWDGMSAGKFSGSASGTELAINAQSGFAGNLIDAQLAGVSKFKVDASGNMTLAGTLTVSGIETEQSNLTVSGTLGVTGASTLGAVSAGAVTATSFSGPLTGNVTGNLTGNVTGNASTATALQTGRTINGVTFDGTAPITVAAAAGTLTGATLAANVLASSLTSVGVLASPHMTAPVVDSGGLTVTGNSNVNGNFGVGNATVPRFGVYNNLSVTGTGNIDGYYGGDNTLTAGANNDVLYGIQVNNITFAVGAFTGTTVAAIHANGAGLLKTGAASITNAYGLQVSVPTIGTNNAAISIGTVGSGNYAIYSASTNSSYLAGGLTINSGGITAIGLVSLAGSVTYSNVAVTINGGTGVTSGTTQDAMYIAQAMNGATSFARVIEAQLNLVGAFTASSGIGIGIDNPALAGGATISTLYGLKVESQIAGTTNYAIFTSSGLVRFGDNVGIAGQAPVAAAFLSFPVPTTAAAQLNLGAGGSAPTSPNNGDMWFDGTNLKIRIGGVTKTVTVT